MAFNSKQSYIDDDLTFNLVSKYNLSLSQMQTDFFHTNFWSIFETLNWRWIFPFTPDDDKERMASMTDRQGMFTPQWYLIPRLMFRESVFALLLFCIVSLALILDAVRELHVLLWNSYFQLYSTFIYPLELKIKDLHIIHVLFHI